LDAFFNDGKTSKRRNCKIEFHLGKLKISYVNDKQVAQTAEWEISKINKIDVRTSSTTLKYGEFPQEVLKLANQNDLNYLISRYPEAGFHKSTYNTFVSYGWTGLIVLIFIGILFGLVFFFYGAPALAEAFARTIPEEYETYIGRNIQETYLQYLEVDTSRSRMVQRFHDELEYESRYDIHIVVVESDIANAFALPGGFIVVYSGILEMIEKEDELAALLAHEVSHVNGRHSLRTISRNLSTYLLLSILTGDVGGFSSVIIENSNLISSLSFSRNLEKEADIDGINLMINADINPQGMVDLFKRFEYLGNSIANNIRKKPDIDSTGSFVKNDSSQTWRKVARKKTEQLLSTHPFPSNRIEYLESALLDLSIRDFQNKGSLEYLFDDIKNETDSLYSKL